MFCRHWKAFEICCCSSEVDCGAPRSLPLSVIMWRGHRGIGSTVIYKCIEGFYNVGNEDTSVCDSEGIWTQPGFLCKGIFLHFSYTNHCISALFHTRMCTHVQFIMCICVNSEVDCGRPPPLHHSDVMWNKSSSLGSVALYVCQTGYQRVGEGNVSICNSNANWSKPDMRCEGTNSLDLCLGITFKETVHTKMRTMSFCSYPRIVPDLYDFSFSM